MTKFSFEVPIKHLTDFHDLQDFHFCLSMLFSYNRYVDYHREIRDSGLKTIWIDNSFNEKFVADDLHDLLYWYREMDAVRLVAPDSIEWETSQIEKSYRDACSHIGNAKTILVCRNYQMYLDLKHLNPGTVAVSYWKRPGMEMAEWTYEQLKKITHRLHFLGLNSIEELLIVNPQSCDTSMPIKLALVGKTLKQWMEEGCPHINTKDLGHQGKSFFEAEMSNYQIDLARRNICDLKGLLTDTTACVKY